MAISDRTIKSTITLGSDPLTQYKNTNMADSNITTGNVVGHQVYLFYGSRQKRIQGGGAQGARAPPLASLIIYSFLNNFVIFTTLVPLRDALAYL